MKQTAPANDETNLILIVPVLTIELGEHYLQSRCLVIDVDDIRRHITSSSLELLDRLRQCASSFLRGLP